MRVLRRLKHDQRGFTLVELLVGTAAGLLVSSALMTMVIGSVHQSARVSSKVDANQRARLALNAIVNQLHSACVAPQIAPVRPGSSGTSITFWHQTGAAVAPQPIQSTIALSGTTLTETDATSTGSAPDWVFGTPSAPRQVATGIAPTSPGAPIFTYYAYQNGAISTTPLTVPLDTERAAKVVRVDVEFTASPAQNGAKYANAPTTIQGAALLRFSPAGFNVNAPTLPCQ